MIDDMPVNQKNWSTYWHYTIRKTDIGTMNDFWYSLYKGFNVEEMIGAGYGIPVRFIKIDLYIFTNSIH